MVNNLIKMACLTRHPFFTLLFLLTSNIYGQNISKHYTSSTQEEGTLYFILPQSGFKSNENKSELIYDLTYLSSNDTITINFSYLDKSERTIDSIAFINNNQRITSQTKNLFVESTKKQWHYRYSSKLLFTDMNRLFDQLHDPKIILYSKDGPIKLNIKKRIWKKQSYINNKIFTLIKHNR